MKKSFSTLSMVLVLIGSIALVAGCASMGVGKKTGVERAAKTTASMQTVDQDIRQASMQIDDVKTTLDHLIKTGQMSGAQPDDVKVAFDTFSENADKMKDIGKKLNKDIDAMSDEGNAYFQSWAKEGGTYTDPNIQQLSEDRRVRLSSAFRDMASSTGSVRANLNAYMSDLDQVKTYLSNDLTSQGIAAIASIARSVEKNGTKLKQSFGPVETAIMQARSELTPGAGVAAGGTSRTQQPEAQPQTQTQPQTQQPVQPGQSSSSTAPAAAPAGQ